jgi:hypothetical protein
VKPLAHVFIGLTCAGLAGCVSVASYPPTWSSPVPRAAGCAHLSGAYQNVGTRAYAEGFLGQRDALKAATLSSFFRNSGSPTPPESTYGVREVRIDANRPDRLEVTMLFADGSSQRQEFVASKGDFSCRDGAIRMTATATDVFPLAYGTMGGSTTLLLSKATDGALIVEQHRWTAGTFFVVLPVGETVRTWSRFEPRPESPGPMPR